MFLCLNRVLFLVGMTARKSPYGLPTAEPFAKDCCFLLI